MMPVEPVPQEIGPRLHGAARAPARPGAGIEVPALFRGAGRSAAGGRLRSSLIAYLYLLPATAILLVFHLFPIVYALYISLFNWRLIQGPFVGLDNYTNAVTSPEFWQALGVTLLYAGGTVPVTLVLSFFIAYALFHKARGRGLYRMIYFLPHITSGVAAALVFRWIVNPRYGVLNGVLDLVNLPHQQWLLEPRGIVELLLQPAGIAVPEWAGGPSLALCCIMIYTIWHSLGIAVVIMLAGLTSIPPELYDAAKVDGAGEWGLLRHVTLPMLTPTLFIMSIISVIGAFQSFNSIYAMTSPHGGPLGTTRNLPMLIYTTFYESGRVGAASAMAFLLLFILLGLTVLQLRVLGGRVTYDR